MFSHWMSQVRAIRTWPVSPLVYGIVCSPVAPYIMFGDRLIICLIPHPLFALPSLVSTCLVRLLSGVWAFKLVYLCVYIADGATETGSFKVPMSKKTLFNPLDGSYTSMDIEGLEPLALVGANAFIMDRTVSLCARAPFPSLLLSPPLIVTFFLSCCVICLWLCRSLSSVAQLVSIIISQQHFHSIS
jgi:hypothetical protein